MPKFPTIPPRTAWHALILINRLSVGWYMMFVGWGKAKGEWTEGMGQFYRSNSYQNRMPDWAPEWLLAIHGYALPWLELVFGALLFVGLFGRVAGLVLFCVAVTIALALLGAGELLPRHHIMFLLTITPLLAVAGSGRFSIDHLLPSSAKAKEE